MNIVFGMILLNFNHVLIQVFLLLDDEKVLFKNKKCSGNLVIKEIKVKLETNYDSLRNMTS